MMPVQPRGARPAPLRPVGNPVVRRRRWPPWAVPALTLLALAAILILRRPGALTRPGFWAEDAVVLFNQARADGAWATLFRPHPGYLLVGERLVAWAASLGPAAWAPGIYAWSALAAHLGVGALLMRPRLRAAGGGSALALMTALVPQDGEIFLRLLSLYWLAAPVLWLLILQDAPRTRRAAAGDYALLLAAGLTGPFAVLFLPLFLARPWREGWTRYNCALLGLALALAAVQGWCLAHYHPVPHPGPTGELRPWLEALFVHLPGGLLGGDELFSALGALAWGFGILATAAAAWLIFRVGEQRLRIAAAVLALGGLAAWAGGMAQHAWMPARLTASGVGGRYFYPAAIAAAWIAILLRRDRAPVVRLGGGIALALLLVASITGTFRVPTEDLRWPDYARRVDAGEAGVTVPIEPDWTFVPARRRGAGPPLERPRVTGDAFRPDGAYPGASWLEDGPHPAVWGSWNGAAGGDAATGELVFGPFPAPGRFLITVSGFPNSGGNGLTVRRVSDRSERRLAAFDPHERWVEFVATTPASWGNEPVEIVARDAATGPGGWLGLSAPYQRGFLGGEVRPVGEGAARFLPAAWRRDARIVGAFAVNVLLILLPGLALLGPVRRRLGGNVIADSFAPLAVFALSAAGGYAVFFLYWFSPGLGKWTSIGVCLLSGVTLWRVGRRRLWENLGGAEAGWAGTLTLLAAVLYLGILLLPRAGGDGVAGLAAHRFMGSPLSADNLIPELFTAKLAAGEDTRMLLGDWQGSDRPPLAAGWGLLARPVAWALGPGGEAADQTAGILFQLAWVPAAWAMARGAGLGRGRAAQVVAAIVPSGFLCLNSVYIWPKLSAAAFAGGRSCCWRKGRTSAATSPPGARLPAGCWRRWRICRTAR